MSFYAQYDTTVSRRNPGHGFCNAKRAVAFSSRALRDAFVDERDHYDMTCRSITRAKALQMLVLLDPNTGDRGLPLDGTDEDANSIVLKKGR